MDDHGNLSAVRKLLGPNTNIEGWAHYCEQMMLDEGYNQPGAGAKDERESRLIRLGQLQDALLRDARFIVGIRMHTQEMSLEQAEDFFVKEGYQSRPIAEVETKRGTADPTYLYYTLGKLEIMKLRSDFQSKEGASFSLERFHDDFMRQGVRAHQDCAEGSARATIRQRCEAAVASYCFLAIECPVRVRGLGEEEI